MDNLLKLLENSSFDMSGCLRSCSNRGMCPFNTQTQTFKCECNQYYTGTACQYDTRPCSINGQCMHAGLCSNTLSVSNTSYECKCSGNFTGTNCETYANECQNEIDCSSHGQCHLNENNEWSCKCYADYSGEKCELANDFVKVVKYAKTSSLIVFLSVITTFCLLILFNDFSSLFCSKPNFKRKKQVITHKVRRFKYHNFND